MLGPAPIIRVCQKNGLKEFLALEIRIYALTFVNENLMILQLMENAWP